jgi:hypothetical protein
MVSGVVQNPSFLGYTRRAETTGMTLHFFEPYTPPHGIKRA